MEEIMARNNRIDLIKALSMISVIIYHFFEYKGTYIGVLLFFVISGYFITSSLMEKEETYLEFLLKRLLRIYPTLLAILVFSLLLYIFFNKFLSGDIVSSSLSSLFGVSNIYQIIKKMSYFERSEDLFPFLHTWTLSIEIQFYILYPILINFLKRQNKENKTNALILIGLSIVSGLIMFYKSYNNYEINEIYYGTDTRIFSLFIGGAVYFYSKGRDFNKKILNSLAIVSVAIIVISTLTVDYLMKINYYGLLYFLSVLGGVIVLAITRTDFLNYRNKIIALLSNLGKKSYSYYMWQYPIMIFAMEYFKWSDMDYGKIVLIQLFFLVLIAEVSYFLLEKNRNTVKKSSFILAGLYLGILFFGPFKKEVIADEIAIETQVKSEIEQIEQIEQIEMKEKIEEKIEEKTEKKIEEKTEKEEEKKEEKIENKAEKKIVKIEKEIFLDDMEARLLGEIGETTKVVVASEKKVKEAVEREKKEKKQKETKIIAEVAPKITLWQNAKKKTDNKVETEAEKIKKEKINKWKVKKEKIKKEKIEKNIPILKNAKYTFIGDSVMKGSEKNLHKKFKNSYVDAKVSRQFTELPRILKKLKKENHLNEVVVIHLGTNGVISEKSFDDSMKMLSNKKVYLINCVVPKRWEKPINKDLEEWSKKYNNIKMINWYKEAKGKRKLFSKDATHPSVTGRTVYTNLIFENVK